MNVSGCEDTPAPTAAPLRPMSQVLPVLVGTVTVESFPRIMHPEVVSEILAANDEEAEQLIKAFQHQVVKIRHLLNATNGMERYYYQNPDMPSGVDFRSMYTAMRDGRARLQQAHDIYLTFLNLALRRLGRFDAKQQALARQYVEPHKLL